MTSKNISANITIGGSVSSSLGKSFGAVRTALEGIGGELKSIKQLTDNLEKQAQAAKKAGKSTAEYEKELAKLSKRRAELEKKQGGLKSVSGMFAKPQKIQFGAVSSAILGKLATSKTFGGMTTSALGMVAQYGPMLASVASLAASAAAGLVAVAAGVFMLGKSAADTVDKTADMADGLGVSTEALQRLRHVAALSGIDADTLDSKLGKLTMSLESAKDGTGPTADALRELGLSYGELSAMNPDEQIMAISTAMKSYNGNMPKISIGNALFGKNSAKFVNMMNQGGDAIRATGKEAKVFTKEQIRQAESFDKTWNKATNAFESVWVGLGTSFIPVISAALDDFTKFMSDPKIKEDLAVFGEIMANVFTMVWGTAKAIVWAIEQLIQPVKWVVNASKWVGEKVGNVLFDQTGMGANKTLGAVDEAGNSLSTGNASLPANVASGAAVAGNSSTTNNNSKSQNININVSGAQNPQLTGEAVNRAIRDSSMEAAGAY